jgi:hypothetical protein
LDALRRTGGNLLLALRIPLVDLLALVSTDAASRSSPGFSTALVVFSNACGADCSCSGQNDSHGGDERNELHPVFCGAFSAVDVGVCGSGENERG